MGGCRGVSPLHPDKCAEALLILRVPVAEGGRELAGHLLGGVGAIDDSEAQAEGLSSSDEVWLEAESESVETFVSVAIRLAGRYGREPTQ